MNQIPKFSLIAGITENFGLGRDNHLPWKSFPKDMAWFRRVTTGSTVIMGRKTWQSLGSKPLPKRDNRIITSQPDKYQNEYNQYLATLDPVKVSKLPSVSFYNGFSQSLIEKSITTENIFIIGGAGLYQEAMMHSNCQTLLITHAKIRLKEVDVKFPNISQSIFKLNKVIESGTDTMTFEDGSSKEVKYEIIEYQKLTNLSPPWQRQVSDGVGLTSNHFTKFKGEEGYLEALRLIMKYGEERNDRTGVGTKALFVMHFRYDLLNDGYPLLTTKKMFTRGIFEELLWFLRGSTDVSELKEKGVHIWDGNSSREFLDSRGLNQFPENDIGPAYGAQFRHAGANYINCKTDYDGQGVDQLAEVIDKLKNDPHSRRIIINLWNVPVLNQMALPPCLFMYQFWVSEDKYLNLSLYQRSGDMGLGVPFNIASASLLMNILGKITGLIPKELIHTIGDAHIYSDHLEPLEKQVNREPRPFPVLEVTDRGQTKVEDFVGEDFVIRGYNPYPGIKMKMAV